MISRKLYRSGNSVVVAIPSYMLNNLDLSPGDTVNLSHNSGPRYIRITPATPTTTPPPGTKPPKRRRSGA